MSWITDCAVWEGIILEPAPAPPLLTDLMAWWDASDLSTITDAGGGSVSDWADKSGNARHLNQSSGAAQPITGTRTLNGLNVLDWQGGVDGMNLPGDIMFDNGSISIFMVFAIDTDPTGAGLDTFRMLISESDAGSVNGLYWMRFTTTQIEMITRNNASSVRFDILDGDPTGGAAHLVRFIDTGTNASIALDGGSATSAAYTRSGTTTLTNFRLGKMTNPTIDGRGLDGYIAEVLIYDHALGGGDITLVEAYLSTKWGL